MLRSKQTKFGNQPLLQDSSSHTRPVDVPEPQRGRTSIINHKPELVHQKEDLVCPRCWGAVNTLHTNSSLLESRAQHAHYTSHPSYPTVHCFCSLEFQIHMKSHMYICIYSTVYTCHMYIQYRMHLQRVNSHKTFRLLFMQSYYCRCLGGIGQVQLMF